MSVAHSHPLGDQLENLASGQLVAVRPRDSATLLRSETRNEAGPAGNIVVVRLAGEIDLFTIRAVHDVLAEAVSRRPADLVVDLAAVTFCCVRGFALLASTAHDARRSGICCAVSGMTSHLDRVASILWPGHLCARYRSVAAAVSAIRIDQSARAQ